MEIVLNPKVEQEIKATADMMGVSEQFLISKIVERWVKDYEPIPEPDFNPLIPEAVSAYIPA